MLLVVGYKMAASKPLDSYSLFILSLFVFLGLLFWSSLYLLKSRKQLVTNIWMTALVSVICFAVLDLAAAYVFIPPRSPHLTADEIVHHRHAPHIVSRIESRDYSTIATMNNFGLRGPDITKRRSEGEYRILMLGDSFTFGTGVEDHQAFPALLERRLNAAGDGRFRVLNGGVESYAPVLSELFLRTYLADVDIDMVVLNFDMSDLLQEVAYRAVAKFDAAGNVVAVPGRGTSGFSEDDDHVIRIAKNIRAWIDRHMYLTRWLLYYVYRALPKRAEPDVLDVVEVANEELLAHTLKGDTRDRREQWAAVFDSIARLKRYCDRRGIRFLLTVYPWGHQVSDDEWVPGRNVFIPEGAIASDQTVRTMEVLSRREGIEMLNFFPAFRQARGTGPIYFARDMHWRPIGHEIVAEQFERYFRGKTFGNR